MIVPRLVPARRSLRNRMGGNSIEIKKDYRIFMQYRIGSVPACRMWRGK